MSSIIKKIEDGQKGDRAFEFQVGDTVEVSTKVREGDKERIQVFRGLVIKIKGGSTNRSFTVRKISQGIGVEKIFPYYSPSLAGVKVIRKGKVRRAKLYYLRSRTGKRATAVKSRS